ncbi:hypothetical protein BB561_004930 [Smittium simulii]|uniref:Riboflavin synthase n=1 Tax=Smittium simulii TaxID=133385 RepID=A0A2T9YD95_9FUNG|nr:hypothetical protein BB561_004930 [Smittium simulii]
MFTGIVEIVGVVSKLDIKDSSKSGGNGVSLTIKNAAKILEDCHIGDSIAVNGTCLTVTEFDEDSFKVGIAPETLKKTCLDQLLEGSKVNLERAMAIGFRFGGHFVQGHVDSTAKIISVKPDENSLWFEFNVLDESLMQYIVPKGFICIDGTSLTVCDVDYQKNTFNIMLIAHTQENTIMTSKAAEDLVNIEVDMLGKYVGSVVQGALSSDSSTISSTIKQLIDIAIDKKLESLDKK